MASESPRPLKSWSVMQQPPRRRRYGRRTGTSRHQCAAPGSSHCRRTGTSHHQCAAPGSSHCRSPLPVVLLIPVVGEDPAVDIVELGAAALEWLEDVLRLVEPAVGAIHPGDQMGGVLLAGFDVRQLVGGEHPGRSPLGHGFPDSLGSAGYGSGSGPATLPPRPGPRSLRCPTCFQPANDKFCCQELFSRRLMGRGGTC